VRLAGSRRLDAFPFFEGKTECGRTDAKDLGCFSGFFVSWWSC
jgi:hypothetical protein